MSTWKPDITPTKMRTRRLADAGVTLRKALAFEARKDKRGAGGGERVGVSQWCGTRITVLFGATFLARVTRMECVVTVRVSSMRQSYRHVAT